MRTSSSLTPTRRATSAASSRLSGEENGEGMAMVRTAPGPRASAASAAVRAESMPPDSPTTTSLKSFLRT